jgi:hypothetical protein
MMLMCYVRLGEGHGRPLIAGIKLPDSVEAGFSARLRAAVTRWNAWAYRFAGSASAIINLID